MTKLHPESKIRVNIDGCCYTIDPDTEIVMFTSDNVPSLVFKINDYKNK